MDRPQVAVNLFQAGANIVKLGIMKPTGSTHDIISYVQGQNHDRNIIGVFWTYSGNHPPNAYPRYYLTVFLLTLCTLSNIFLVSINLFHRIEKQEYV